MIRNTTDYDVIIAGAGPAGTTAAHILVSHGLNVCMVDKQHFPRPKLCAGLLTWKSIQLLKRIFGYSESQLIDQGIVTNTCRDYRIYLGPKVLVRRRLDFPLHFVNRMHYDNLWLQEALKAGCHVITGHKVSQVNPIEGMVFFEDGSSLRADTIIGADGVWSKVRQSISSLTPHHKRWLHQLAATIESVHPSSNLPKKEAYAAIHFGYLPWGYAWSFPGKGHQVLGIGGLHRKSTHSIRQHYDNFLKALDVDQVAPRQSYPLPYGNTLRQPAHGRVLLVGDACGLADPLLGEGIYYAHRSGELAAHAIIHKKSDETDPSKRYITALNNHILKELRWIKLFRNLLFTGGSIRRFRGLRLFFFLMPKRLEAMVQGQKSFCDLLWPWK